MYIDIEVNVIIDGHYIRVELRLTLCVYVTTRSRLQTKPGLSNLIVSRGRIIFQIVSAGRMS